MCENPCRSAVSEILRPVRLHQQPFHVQSLKSPFFPVLMLGLNFSKSSSSHLEAIELLTCDWLISNLCYQAIEQVYPIKWLVSVFIFIYISICCCLLVTFFNIVELILSILRFLKYSEFHTRIEIYT